MVCSVNHLSVHQVHTAFRRISQNLDCGLDCGLDFGLDYGLKYNTATKIILE